MSAIACASLRSSQRKTTALTLVLNCFFLWLGNRGLAPTPVLLDVAIDTAITSMVSALFVTVFTLREVRIAAQQMRAAGDMATAAPAWMDRLATCSTSSCRRP